MPYADPEKRKQRQREYRAERSAEYMQWLYQRRALVRRQRDLHAAVLEEIASGVDKNPAGTAALALKKAGKWEREIGNRFNHSLNKPYFEQGD